MRALQLGRTDRVVSAAPFSRSGDARSLILAFIGSLRQRIPEYSDERM